jgi:hypothetical protein
MILSIGGSTLLAIVVGFTVARMLPAPPVAGRRRRR